MTELELYLEVHGAGLSHFQLAILPRTTPLTVVGQRDWLVSMISEFLDGPTSSDR